MFNFTTMKDYISQNKERFFEELFSLLRIPSVSAKADHKPDMYACAERLSALLLEAGADSAGLWETAGNPVVFGQNGAPTRSSLYWGLTPPGRRPSGDEAPTTTRASCSCISKHSNTWCVQGSSSIT